GCIKENSDDDILIKEVETRLLDKNNLSAKVDYEFLWIKIDTESLQGKDSIINSTDFKLKDNNGTVYENPQLRTITNKSSTEPVWLIFDILVSETGAELIYETEEKQESFTLPDYESVGKSGDTALYILNNDGHEYDYPNNLTANETATITVGIKNEDGAALNYELCIGLMSDNIDEIDYKGNISNNSLVFKDHNTYFSSDKIIENNETWERKVDFTVKITGDYRLSIWLKRSNQNYRSVNLMIDIIE
ncbi:MAG: DUF1616 domain-containing protein, partial [Thermoplasmatota archaeon]